jgi:hypothetical protein
MRRPQRASGDDGVSLVELLVAISFIAGVMLALTHGSITGLSSVKTAASQVDADQLVDDTIENLKAQPYANVVPPGSLTSYALTSSTAVRGTTSYTITGTVSWMDDACNGSATTAATQDYLQFDVSAAWTLKGQPRTARVVTYRTPAIGDKAPVRVSSTC